jgi:hypothetical protein
MKKKKKGKEKKERKKKKNHRYQRITVTGFKRKKRSLSFVHQRVRDWELGLGID